MKIRILSLAAALCLLLAGALAEPVNAIPAVGDKFSGFTVNAVEDYPTLEAKIVYLTHDKTEGPVIWIANDDTERSFAIGFRTHYDSDTGVPHVFEHAALSGSERYPDSQLFFNMMSNTCQTYLNASTHTAYTIYPCASISDKQLLKFADVYLAGVFEPLVLTDIHAMQREAYRYQLADADADLELTGTVYSEMLGYYYTNEEAYEKVRLSFPGSWYAICTGGQPGVIEEMTQQDLIDFHDTYYQPSNALTMLYGDLNLQDFLSLLAEYYDRYEKTEVSMEDPGYTPFTGYSEVSRDVCAAAESDPETNLSYAIPLRGLKLEDVRLLAAFLPTAVNNDASALHTIMMERFPSAKFEVSVYRDSPEPMLYFDLESAGETTAAEFSAAVQEGIAAVLEEGIRYDALKTVVKSVKKDNATARENSGLGVDLAQPIMDAYVHGGSVDSYFRNTAVLLDCQTWLDSGILETVLREQVVNPQDSRVIVINKVPGLQEEKLQAAAQALIDKKAAMSPEEISAVVDATKEYETWVDEAASVSMINEVNVLTVEELPQELHTATASVTSRNGVRYITSEAEGCQLVEMTLQLPADWIPTAQLQQYAQTVLLLGKLRTGSHSREEIVNLVGEYGLSFATNKLKDGEDLSFFSPVLTVSMACLREDMPDAVALIGEILTDTQFDEYDAIRYNATDLLYNCKVLFPSYLPHYIAVSLAKAQASASGLYDYYIGDIPYMTYLESVSTMDDTALAAEGAGWKQMLSDLINRDNLKITVVSDAQGIADTIAQCDGMTASWPIILRETVDYSAELEKLPARIAVKVPGSTNYNIQYVSAETAGYTYSPEMDILNSLVYDQILVPVLRYRNGVYSPLNNIDENGLYILAYRDPDVTRTFDEVIPTISGQVANIEITDEALNNLVVSGYTKLVLPEGPISTAVDAVYDVLTNSNSQRDLLRSMTAYKTLTVDGLKANAGLYDALSQSGVIVTCGPAATIDANADRYDLIIDWYVK